MSPKCQPVPAGFHTITPHLVVKGAARAIDFYTRAFGAQELFRNTIEGTDVVMHAQLALGDSFVMLNDEFAEHGALGPDPERSSPVTIHLYVEDVDAAFERATKAGCEVTFPLQDSFWGDRYAQVRDPFGHGWSLASRIEELTPAEIAERAKAAFGGQQ